MKIAVLGCGILGTKIAGELAYHGHRVKIWDVNIEALNAVYRILEEDKKQLTEDGLLFQKNFVGQVLCMSRLEETVNDADFIFEAVKEDLEIKKDLLERVSHLCKGDTIIGSNTLRLRINGVMACVMNKDRSLGLRFLYPVYYIPEVEINPASFTSQTSIQRVREMLEKMGKTLFFRSGNHPLILSEEQREERKALRVEQLLNSSGIPCMFEKKIPVLSHEGNVAPVKETRRESTNVETECGICMNRMRDCLLCPCHHMITCYECSKMLHNRRDCCPICRKDITEVIRVYHS
ncbi:3-hydroxybutyryl-CoA dehydrogenase-like [Ostrea edulis]|uniref:3-hydroxybutyryl-CoA dehydrogenase-like n=1 Tax=Ostrea edulis TaxID=37623 RepID=UPI0020944748|nr:3-hydroxybutyryl-CoA dehydrogenase-like [Ostrea edulis]